MTDDIERELRGLDTERPLPPELYGRLEAALLDDAGALFDALDAPRPIPAATRAALEHELILAPRRRDRRSLFLGAAAAVLLAVGSVAAMRAGGSSPNRQVAVGPVRSVPAAGVPPVLRTPDTTAAIASAAEAPPTTRRSTTTTTWNCGLCAQNGAVRSGAGAPAASPTTTVPSAAGSDVAAATLASSPSEISTVDPTSGPRRGGTIVTLTGFGFAGANGVRFGSLTAVNFTVVSDTEIRVMAPRSAIAQKVTVAVTYPDGTTTPVSDSGPFFTYS